MRSDFDRKLQNLENSVQVDVNTWLEAQRKLRDDFDLQRDYIRDLKISADQGKIIEGIVSEL